MVKLVTSEDISVLASTSNSIFMATVEGSIPNEGMLKVSSSHAMLGSLITSIV